MAGTQLGENNAPRAPVTVPAHGALSRGHQQILCVLNTPGTRSLCAAFAPYKEVPV